jgi:hypothetical protein
VLDDLAERLEAAGAEWSDAAAALSRADPGPDAFAGAAPGRLGELGRDLHRGYVAALSNRIREATGQSARLSALAGTVGTAAGRYAAADDSAARRHR